MSVAAMQNIEETGTDPNHDVEVVGFGFELCRDRQHDVWDATHCGIQDSLASTREEAEADLPRMAYSLGVEERDVRVVEVEAAARST